MTLSRHRPSFNVTRLRVRDEICEIGPDDLRFRSWEVERLFRELYGRPLPPDEVAELERRTGGWVAALQLFNVATSGLPAVERRAAIAHVGRRAGPDWDYLADNVLSGLPDELQLFLLETATIQRLTAELCDELRTTHDSWRQLEELDRLQLVTPSIDAPGSYRSHEVLRSHLDGLLREWEGADAVHKRYRQAAETLERHEQFTDAVLAYCRGEDWAERRPPARRPWRRGRRRGRGAGCSPAVVARPDRPVAAARGRAPAARGRSAGRRHRHVPRRRAQRADVAASAHGAPRAAAAGLAGRPFEHTVARLGRRAPRRRRWRPVVAVGSLGNRSPHDELALGVARLLGADVAGASEALRRARDRPDASPTVGLAASIGLLVATYLAGSATPALPTSWNARRRRTRCRSSAGWRALPPAW